MSNTSADYSVYQTTDHAIFSYLRGNRDISKSHVKWLVEELKSDANILRYNPILVNEKKQVVDGQHRLEAARQLGVPVWFIEEKGLNLKDAQALNQGSKPWSPLSYAKSHAKLGNKNYETYIEFRNIYGFNHDVLMKYLSLTNPITGEMFREGKFQVKNAKISQQLSDDLVEFADTWKVLQGKHRAYIRTFALAFKEVWEGEGYSQAKMIKKFKANPAHKLDWGTVPDTVIALKALYASIG